MGGIFKKHRATYCTEGARLWYDSYNNRSVRNATGVYRQGIKCPMIKDVNGNEWHYIYASRGYASNYPYNAEIAGFNLASFNYLTAFATSDRLENWNLNDWQINPIGNTSQGKACMFNEQVMQQTYTINITNPRSSDTYQLNTSSVWYDNTYYYKEDDNYILLESMPEDWFENYGTYYIYVPGEITVTCIRFRRPICVCSDSQYDISSGSPQYTEVQALGYSYYLDEPITIPPQGTVSFTIKFSPMEM